LLQIDCGFRPKNIRATQPTYQISEVWISPSIFLLHWADGLLGKIFGLKAQFQPVAHLRLKLV
jgi:hypothetical protein